MLFSHYMLVSDSLSLHVYFQFAFPGAPYDDEDDDDVSVVCITDTTLGNVQNISHHVSEFHSDRI